MQHSLMGLFPSPPTILHSIYAYKTFYHIMGNNKNKFFGDEQTKRNDNGTNKYRLDTNVNVAPF